MGKEKRCFSGCLRFWLFHLCTWASVFKLSTWTAVNSVNLNTHQVVYHKTQFMFKILFMWILKMEHWSFRMATFGKNRAKQWKQKRKMFDIFPSYLNLCVPTDAAFLHMNSNSSITRNMLLLGPIIFSGPFIIFVIAFLPLQRLVQSTHLTGLWL